MAKTSKVDKPAKLAVEQYEHRERKQPSENLRLAALDRCGILDTPPDPHFDRITRLAARLFRAPMAAISFVTHDRSWFKSTYGFQQIQLARSASFCSHTVVCPEGLVIPDATADERFAGLGTVAGQPRVRFYAGVPVVTTEGFAVGAVAVMDTCPRDPLPEAEIGALHDFSALISRELNARSSAGAASLRNRAGEWRSVESTAANCLQVEGLRGIVVNLRDITERQQYEEQLRISQDQLRQVAARVESAREEERARISREVHDEFGQMLSLLKLDFETLASLHRPRGAQARAEFDQRVAALIRGIDLSMNTVRRIAAELRPAVFEDLGLAAALNWQLQEFESRTGIRCRRRGLARNAGLAAEPSLAVFRIFQEILTNVIRHAHATSLAVAVETDRDWFTLRVSDNGKGFDPKLLSPSRSLGLLSMRERATMHGGTIEWSGRRKGGTTVTVRLPRAVDGASAKT